MTVQEIREKYFIPGSPVILCNSTQLMIGERFEHALSFGHRPVEMPCTILRMATLSEYLATLKPEYRLPEEKCDPSIKYFFEVSVD